MFKITFTQHGYVAAVVYNRCATREQAIDVASMGVYAKWDRVRCERV